MFHIYINTRVGRSCMHAFVKTMTLQLNTLTHMISVLLCLSIVDTLGPVPKDYQLISTSRHPYEQPIGLQNQENHQISWILLFSISCMRYDNHHTKLDNIWHSTLSSLGTLLEGRLLAGTLASSTDLPKHPENSRITAPPQ